jgi:hypothetical protein
LGGFFSARGGLAFGEGGGFFLGYDRLFGFFALAAGGDGGFFAGSFLEFFHAARRVNEFLFARVERMALAAQLGADGFERAAGGELAAAGAGDGRVGMKFRMDVFLHIFLENKLDFLSKK